MKTPLLLATASAIVCCTLTLSSAQQQTGPKTLENLLQSAEAQLPSGPPEAESTAGSQKRPAGTVSRPPDGVKHPDLDNAWAVYDVAVAKAAEGIRAAIAKQFDAATSKGDLDAAEKWQKSGEKFEKAGEVPTDTDTKSAVSSAVADYKRAKDELTKAYEALVKSLTVEKNIGQAKVVRDEMRRLSESTPATAPKPASHNAEGIWRWGKNAMVFYPNGTAKEIFPDKGGNPVNGKWKSTTEKEVTLRLDNGFIVVGVLTGSDSMTASCKSAEGRSHEVLATKISKTSTFWRWFNGGFVELCGDGCVNGDPAGRWRRDGGRVIITWPAGWVDNLVFSPDGSRLAGTNQSGVKVSGELIR